MQATSGTHIKIAQPKESEITSLLSVTGPKKGVATAILLIKMTVLSANSASEVPEPTEYVREVRAEAKINISTFYREVKENAFCMNMPKPNIEHS